MARIGRRAFRIWLLLAIFAVLLALTGGLASAQEADAAGLAKAIEVQERHNPTLLGIRGVVGTAVGVTEAGQPAVLVLTEGPGVSGLPRSLDGVTVEVLVTGKIEALDQGASSTAKAGGGSQPSTTSRWPRPVPIGISTGNEGQCSAGTIGARVTNGATVFALSNNHVYALENAAALGSNVLQPGRYDTGCAADPNDVIGQLSAFEPLKFDGSENTIDAAIALTSTANLGKSTPSNGYGTPKTATAAAAVGQKVQKYGRTTKLTKGTVSGINATVNVGYGSGTARFVNQIIVYSGKPFIKAGDSGSLLVNDPGRNPVGLLFAGTSSGQYGIANPIGLVLARFGVTVDGE